MKTFDPYMPIKKVPLFTDDGQMQSRMYAIKAEVPIKNKDGAVTMQPYECGTVSEQFMLIPNADVRDFNDDLLKVVPGNWELGKEMFDGHKYMMTQYCKDGFATHELEVGDTISLGIMWRNAYDMTRSLSFDLFLNVLSCTNGMTHNQWFNRFRFKHTPNNSNWADVLKEAGDTIVNASNSVPELVDNLNRLNNIKVNKTSDIRSIRNILDKDTLGYTQWGKVIDRFVSQDPANNNHHTLWDFTQACTHTFWNSGKSQDKVNSWADLTTNEKCVRKLTSIKQLSAVAEA